MSISAGCGERRAYDVYAAFESLADNLRAGDPCDPTKRAPFTVQIELTGGDLPGAASGRLFARTAGGAPPAWFPAEGIAVEAGSFRSVVAAVTTKNSGSGRLTFLLDRGEDGRCTPGEDLVAEHGPGELDATAFVLRYAIEPAKWAPACEPWR